MQISLHFRENLMSEFRNEMIFFSYECHVPNGYIQTSSQHRNGVLCNRKRNIPENLIRGIRNLRYELLRFCRRIGEPYLKGFITDAGNRESIIRRFDNASRYYHYEVTNRLIPGISLLAKQYKDSDSVELPNIGDIYAGLLFDYSCLPFTIPDNFKKTVVHNNAVRARDILLTLNSSERPDIAEIARKIFAISSSFLYWRDACPEYISYARDLQKIAASLNEYSDLSLLMSDLVMRLVEITLRDERLPPESIPIKVADWTKPGDNYEDCPLFKGLDL